MFDRLDDGPFDVVRFRYAGHTISARAGDTVAAALLAAGIVRFGETAVSGAARGPHCMMGVCGDCRVDIAGRGSRQACGTLVEDGLEITPHVPHRGDEA